MCLHVAPNQTKLIEEYFGDKEERVFWKTVTYGDLINSYCTVIGTRHQYIPGINKSNRDSISKKTFTSTEINKQRVNFGIHVYTNKQRAILDTDSLYNKYLVIPVICRKSNLVAFGKQNDAVFTQVRFRKRDYEAALKKEPE